MVYFIFQGDLQHKTTYCISQTHIRLMLWSHGSQQICLVDNPDVADSCDFSVPTCTAQHGSVCGTKIFSMKDKCDQLDSDGTCSDWINHRIGLGQCAVLWARSVVQA